MRYLSKVFQPTITIPKNAKIKSTEITSLSQKLMVECGLVRPTSSGFYTMLPLGKRALNKLERLVRTCLEATGAQQISLPALTSASLWDRSGRLETSQDELLQVKDRHNKKYVLAPTHEEAIADLLSELSPLSYKQLPLLLYQSGLKYRDELRPKHGLLRAREFLMADAYGAHAHDECALALYARLTRAYLALFRALRLPVHRVLADSGEMGGSLSHEWHACAPRGEDRVRACGRCGRAGEGEGAEEGLGEGEGEGEGADVCLHCGGEVQERSSIEVGHTFILGTKYSEALNAQFVNEKGTTAPILMSCYGIGVSRLMAACLEVNSTERGLRWPSLIAPYTVLVVGPKEGSREWEGGAWQRAEALGRALAEGQGAEVGGDVLVDDRHNLTIGKRLLQADKMGYPITIVCGKSSLSSPERYEVIRSDSEPTLLTLPEVLQYVDSFVKEHTDVQTHVDSISKEEVEI